MQAKSPCTLRIDDDARFSSPQQKWPEKKREPLLKHKNRNASEEKPAVFFIGSGSEAEPDSFA
jgi:hypothetical protein